ncbi:MAG: flagellar filament capping protein FliD [Bryobacteraceae bacterium]|nr:flagellar filament capping protein FliD [Bryobacteraceae bacterium]
MSTSSVFSGSSRFSTDFAQVITRTVSIASLPLNLLQQQKAKLDGQATALGRLSGKTSGITAALSAIGNSFGSSSFTTSSSNVAAATVTVGEGATPGSWDLQIGNLGAATVFVAQGFPPVPNPSSGAYTTQTSQTLTLDPDPTDGNPSPTVFTLSPANQTMQALVDEINKVAGSSVQASIVNIGSSSSPSYQLSLQSKKLGPVDITLTDGSTTTSNTALQRGSSAQYTISGTPVSTDSRLITLAPGVTADLKATTSSAMTVSVNTSSSSLRSSLNSFISAYNNAVAEVDTHRGNKTAALSGDSILQATASALRQLVNSGPAGGGFPSLQQLGIGFDQTGNLYLDDTIFARAVTGSGLANAKTFFGSVTGSGWLKSATKTLDSLTNLDTGLIGSAIVTAGKASKADALHIAEQQERIDLLETNLKAQMAAADAMVAMLEQQATYFSNMFGAMRTNQAGYQ